MDSAGNSHFISAHGDPLGLAAHCVIGGMGSLSSAVVRSADADRGSARAGPDPIDALGQVLLAGADRSPPHTPATRGSPRAEAGPDPRPASPAHRGAPRPDGWRAATAPPPPRRHTPAGCPRPPPRGPELLVRTPGRGPVTCDLGRQVRRDRLGQQRVTGPATNWIASHPRPAAWRRRARAAPRSTRWPT